MEERLGFGMMCGYYIIQCWMNLMKTLLLIDANMFWGDFVGNYWRNNGWVNLAEICHTFNYFQISLNSFNLNPIMENNMVWGIEPSGKFKVSSMFRSDQFGNPSPWTKASMKGLTPIINKFF